MTQRQVEYNYDFTQRFGFALRRRSWLLFWVAASIFGLILVVGRLLPNIYVSEALIQIEQPASADLAGLSIPYAASYVETLRQRVMTDEYLGSVIAELGVYPDGVTDPREKIKRLKNDVFVRMESTAVRDPRSGKEMQIDTAFTAGFQSTDPVIAVKIVTKIAERFVAESVKFTSERTQQTTSFLAQEADEAQEEIVRLEARLADFKQRYAMQLPESTAATMNNMATTERELDEVLQEIAEFEGEILILQSQLSELDTSGENVVYELQREYKEKSSRYSENHPDIVQLERELLSYGIDPVGLIRLEAELESKRQELAAARQRYADDHPDVKALSRSVSELEMQLSSMGQDASDRLAASGARAPGEIQVAGKIKAAEAEMAALKGRQRTLQSRLTEFQQRLVASPQVEKEYQALLREVNDARATYEGIRNREIQAEFTAAVENREQGQRLVIVRAPTLPEDPISPNRLAIVLVGFVLASLVGIISVVAREFLDSTVRDAADAREIFDVPPLAVVPVIQNYRDARRSRVNSGLAYLLAGGFIILIISTLSLMVLT